MLMVSNGDLERSSAQQFNALGQIHALAMMIVMPCSADAIAYSNSFINEIHAICKAYTTNDL
jgi:hypothetical protein